jgi:hypothetical protein
MKCSYSKPVQWLGDDGGWQVGRIMLCDDEPIQLPAKINTGTHIIVQVQPSHAGTPVFVERRRLSPYPASPIEQP